jgi:hypothetical protein
VQQLYDHDRRGQSRCYAVSDLPQCQPLSTARLKVSPII